MDLDREEITMIEQARQVKNSIIFINGEEFAEKKKLTGRSECISAVGCICTVLSVLYKFNDLSVLIPSKTFCRYVCYQRMFTETINRMHRISAQTK